METVEVTESSDLTPEQTRIEEEVQEESAASIWCDGCKELLEEPCLLHAATMEDQTFDLATATLPASLAFEQHEGMLEKGVFTRVHIPISTSFGPLMGPLYEEPDEECRFAIPTEDGGRYYHLADDKYCNWMKYVRLAETEVEHNLMACLREDSIYFISVRAVPAKEELRVWYSKKYAKIMQKPLTPVPLYTTAEGVFLTVAEVEEDGQAQIESTEITEVPHTETETIPAVISDMEVNVLDYFLQRPPEQTVTESIVQEPVKESVPEVELPPKQSVRTSTRLRNKRASVAGQEDIAPANVHAEAESSVAQPPVAKHTGTSSVTDVEEKDASEKDTVVIPEKTAPAVITPLPARRAAPSVKRPAKRTSAEVDEEYEYTPSKLVKIERVSKRMSEYRASLRRHPETEEGSSKRKVKRCRGKKLHPPALDYPHACSECAIHFKTQELLDLHNLIHVAPEEVKDEMRVCPQCTYARKDVKIMSQHADAHGKTARQLEAMWQECPYCGEFWVRLRDHVKLKHPEEYEAEMKNAPESQFEFGCESCNKRFATELGLQQHQRAHSGYKPVYRCIICQHTCKNANDLHSHVNTHLVDECFTCSQCEKKYPRYRALTKHMSEYHDPNKEAACEYCGKAFRNKTMLTQHLKSHSSVMGYGCETCGKQFKLKSHLNNHIGWVHLKNKVDKRKQLREEGRVDELKKDYLGPRRRMEFEQFPYKCLECTLGYLKRGMLVNHVLSHHPDIPLESIPA